MEFAFSMPNLMQVKAITMPWESTVTGADQLKLAKWAEKLGYAMLAVPEHFIVPQSVVELSGAHHLAAYPTMAAYGGATETIRVNSCIALLALQHPIITAKTLATMDWLTSGRVTVTFAAGWLKGEFDMLGVPFHERGALCEEYIQAILALWTQENPEFSGKYVNFRDVAFEPRCHRKPHLNVWFGGEADAVLKRIARYATGWWPAQIDPATIPDRIDFIKSQPDYNGQLREVFYGFSTGLVGRGHVVIDDPKARPGQTRQEVIDRLGWFKDLGVTMSSVPNPPELRDLEQLYDYTQWVAEEIMPALR